METVSENSRGRGRPRAFTEEEWESKEDAWQYPEMAYYYTQRGKQNIIYASRAEERIEAKKGEGSPADGIPQAVLTELGRIEGEDQFWSAAIWYEEEGHRMRAKDAAAAIRRMRTGKKPPQDTTDKLADALWSTLRDHLKSHPDTIFAEAAGALEIVKKDAHRLPWA